MEKNCTKCGSILKKGFLYVRNSDDAIMFNFVVWVEGEKKDITEFMGPNANAPQFPVTVYKCDNCGHLEFYADHAESWRH